MITTSIRLLYLALLDWQIFMRVVVFKFLSWQYGSFCMHAVCFLAVILLPQNKEGILPVATLFIALYVLCRSMSASNVAPEVAILSSAL